VLYSQACFPVEGDKEEESKDEANDDVMRGKAVQNQISKSTLSVYLCNALLCLLVCRVLSQNICVPTTVCIKYISSMIYVCVSYDVWSNIQYSVNH